MSQVAAGALGVCLALLLGAGCDATGPATGGSPAASAVTTTKALVAAAPVVTGGGPPGVHVSLAGTAHHARGLERQPDGTYKIVCFDDPDALRPATPRPGARR